MKLKNKIKAVKEKAAYQILAFSFLRNLWIAIACMQILQEKAIQGSETAAGTPPGLAVMMYRLARLTKTP